MIHTPVASSHLKAVGYDPDTRTLEVVFLSGHHYRYQDVPPEEYQMLMNVDAHGSYGEAFTRYIKPRYQGVQVGHS